MKKSGVRAGRVGGGLFVAVLLAGMFMATSAVAQALAPETASVDSLSLRVAQDDVLAQGQAVYEKTCASCHQPGGIGVEGTYPPLLGNPGIIDAAFVEDVVRNGISGPIEVAGVTYDSIMSSKSERLSDEEIAAVAAYVVDLSLQDISAVVVDTGALPEGVAARGKQLFRGDVSLSNGASACAACHVAGPVGNLGGTSLGPDLTYVSSRLGGVPGLSGWLTNPPSPTMTPVFTRHPLTTGEIADLAAFLDFAPTVRRRTYVMDGLLFGGLVGGLILFAGMAIAWRGMRQTYVEKLRSRR